MSSIRRILYAVRNPEARTLPGITKAASLARSLGASLELFHALSSPVFIGLQPMTDESIADLKVEALARNQKRLEKFASSVRRRGSDVTCFVAWDYPPHEAIVRRAQRTGADLIIADCHKGGHRIAWLMQLTDWELLRVSSVPVLLLRNARPYHRGAILAAVDPGHRHAKPLDLDDRILTGARELSEALHARLHVVHATFPSMLPVVALDPSMGTQPMVSYGELKELDRDQFARFIKSARIGPRRRHLVDGDPRTVIPRVARKLKAELVVMGAASRSALRRVFIGNTAERILDDLPCDVLVVKPEHFKKRVRAKSRGMRVAPVSVALVSA